MNEVLVIDKGIGYEIFLLSKTSGEEIHPIGSSIFKRDDPEHQNNIIYFLIIPFQVFSKTYQYYFYINLLINHPY